MPMNSGRGLQVGQSFPIDRDEDLPIYKDAEHLLSAGGIRQGAGLSITLHHGLASIDGRDHRFAIHRCSFSSHAGAVARLAVRATDVASASRRS
jgi:hypothetical protein